jgi:hypothetical protein
VLIGIDDVESGLGEEAADRRDQARLIGAGKQQTGCRSLGDPSMIAAPARADQCGCRLSMLQGPRQGVTSGTSLMTMLLKQAARTISPI